MPEQNGHDLAGDIYNMHFLYMIIFAFLLKSMKLYNYSYLAGACLRSLAVVTPVK